MKTTTAIPEDPRSARAQAILALCREHTGKPLTIAWIAGQLGRKPGKAFQLDLAAARHLALDAEEELTNCYYDPRVKSYVMHHLYGDAEDGKAFTPLKTVSRQVRTRFRNVGRHGRWLRQHGEDADDRRYGKLAELAAQSAETHLQMVEVLERDIIDRRQS